MGEGQRSIQAINTRHGVQIRTQQAENNRGGRGARTEPQERQEPPDTHEHRAARRADQLNGENRRADSVKTTHENYRPRR